MYVILGYGIAFLLLGVTLMSPGMYTYPLLVIACIGAFVTLVNDDLLRRVSVGVVLIALVLAVLDHVAGMNSARRSGRLEERYHFERSGKNSPPP
jgi:hypothetical protein